jgi:phosphatidylglycerol---prolipoprotein diacylglyceryl transferase
VHPLLLQLGHVAIPTYGVFTAIALLAALAAAMHFARLVGLNPEKVWNLGLLIILTTLIGSRLLLVIANFTAFRKHPFWVLGLTTVRSPGILLGGAALAIVIAGLYALAEGLPLLRTADCAAPALALGFTLNRIGAFFAGIGYGTPTAQPWGIVYASHIAALWYRTPLGITLHPVQLYVAAASALLFALLAWRLPHRKQDGDIMGAWLFLYGLAIFFLSLYDGDTTGREIFNGAITITQALASCAVIAGGLIWIRKSAPVQRPAETV